MSQLFEILEINDCTIVVVCKTYIGVSAFLSELEAELHQRQFEGEIFFDLLLSNGLNAKNRFLRSNFCGTQIMDFQICSHETIKLRCEQRIINFYRTNISILYNGILLRNDIEKVKKYLFEIDL